MTQRNNDSAVTEAQLRTLANGLLTELPAGTPLVVAGVTYTSDQLAKVIQDHLDTYTRAREARATAHREVATREAAHPGVRKLLGNVHKTFDVKFGDENPVLLKFGFAPKKEARELTFDEKVAKTEKARATREKNHPKSGGEPAAKGGEA